MAWAGLTRNLGHSGEPSDEAASPIHGFGRHRSVDENRDRRSDDDEMRGNNEADLSRSLVELIEHALRRSSAGRYGEHDLDRTRC